ncbi:GGDEF domain-containing response regulator [Thiotrichales bacterium 19S3-7]|nr:GGDEF domain-containing response regulator [Thiotrichales bacterium 19S3-7]MCF6803005.1 GGDEF domain-containing response regulator [Thiotrichales bacterium 19S3-11]
MSNNYQILVIDNDQEDRQLIRQLLIHQKQQQFEIKELFDADSAIKYCHLHTPDCILVDYTLPGLNGLDFIKILHEKLPNQLHNIIMLTNQNSKEVAAKAIKSGAFDYISKHKLSAPKLTNSINESIKRIKVKQQKKDKEKKFHQMIDYDPLTKLANQKAFKQKIEQQFHAAQRYNRLSALLLIDLDKFHLINDSLGYDAGDELLKLIADRINKNIRTSDFAARLEEDHFAIILDQIKEPEHASIVASKLIDAINEPYELNHKTIRISINVGLCCFPQRFNLPNEVIDRANVAMYYAKLNKKQTLWYYPQQ